MLINIYKHCAQYSVIKKTGSLVLAVVLFLLPSFSHAVTVIDNDFNNKSWGSLSAGSSWAIQPSGGVGNTPAARLTYSTSGTSGRALVLNVKNLQSNQYYIEFDVKMQGSVSGGSKFVKFFGSTATHSQNNMTLGYDAYSSVQKEVAYYKDTICTARFDGSQGGTCNPSFKHTSGPIDMRGGNWGHYKAWVKRADPGVKNGEVKVWWNGTLRAHITNMDSNPSSAATPGFERIEFGGYLHSTFSGSPWYLWIDNLKVSTDGTQTSTPAPPPPTPDPDPAVDTTPPAVPTGLIVR